MGHGFTPLEPKSRLNILFMGIDQYASISDHSIRLRRTFPGVFEESSFNEVFRESGIGTGKRSAPAPNEYPPEQVPQLRRAGVGIRDHEFDGIKLQLKVGRHETEGVKEIWDLSMKPGFFCDWDNFMPVHRMFYVTDGKLSCYVKTSAEETVSFTAEKENVVIIPPYYPFGFKVIEEARVYDMDCSARLQDLFEEYGTLTYNDPSRKNKESFLELGRQYGLNCTDIGYNP